MACYLNRTTQNVLDRQRQSEFKSILQNSKDSVYGQVSQFWKDMLTGRENFVSEEEFNVFRNATANNAYGLGDYQLSYDEEKRRFDSMIRLLKAEGIPPQVFEDVGEPLIGSPEVFPFGDNLFSANFVKNVASAHTIATKFQAISGAKSQVDVCEIGAGFGATAYALHDYLDIRSYTVIDLPENLYLSSMYLPLCLQDKSHCLMHEKDPRTLSCESNLNFCVPGTIDSLRKNDFDLIINVASMGEMPLETAQAYSAWVSKHLKPEGLFYFVNRQGVEQANGAKCLTDFKLHELDIQSIVPRTLPAHPLGPIHYEIIVSGQSPIEPYCHECMDAIGHLASFGFGDVLGPIIDDFLSGTVNEKLRDSLRRLYGFFCESNRARYLFYCAFYTATVRGLRGNVRFSCGNV